MIRIRGTKVVARTTGRLADAMSAYLATTGSPSRASGLRRRFGTRLDQACRDLKEHGAMSADEERLVWLALEGSSFGEQVVPFFLADKARTMGWRQPADDDPTPRGAGSPYRR